MSERQRFTYGVVRIHPRPKIGLRGSHDIRTGATRKRRGAMQIGHLDFQTDYGKSGFRDTGEVNWPSYLYKGDERPVKIMRLDYSL